MSRIYNYVIAANDTDATLKLAATAICDGTNDQVEINAAISAAVGVTSSILLLPGTYSLGAAIDFTPLTAANAKWLLFEASDTFIQAGANLTTMVDMAPGAGGQIVTCLDARFGVLSGNKASYTVTQIIKMARFSDNRLRVNELLDGSAHALSIQTAGVSDYPTGNNQLEFNTIRSNGGTGIHMTCDTNSYGFTGNVVRFGQIIDNDNGIILGTAVNQNAVLNTFLGSVIEWNTGYGIFDYCGGNFFYVNNTNANGINGIGSPSGMTYPSTFNVNIDDGADATVTSQHWVLSYGRLIGQS